MNTDNFKKWPYFDEAEIAGVADILRSGKINRWTGGVNLEFEKKLCESVGCKYSIALSNGTVAIELALHAIGLEIGDEVIVPCRTFVATASAVVAQGGVPIVADVDINSQNITAETIEPLITPKTKAIIAVHHAGWPCDMDEILALAKKHSIYVIEDCAQAHGAMYKGRPVGSIGHVGAWSYCQDKIISTGGEGGAVTTNDEGLYFKMWSYKDHGRSYDAVYRRQHPAGFRWLIESFGTNMRLTEMQAYLGLCALEKLPSWILRRRNNAEILNDAFKDLHSIRRVFPRDFEYCSYYKYYCFIEPKMLKDGASRDSIADEIVAAGLPAFAGTCWNISAEKCFSNLGWERSHKDLPNAYSLKDTSLMLLVHPTIELDEMKQASEIIKKIILKSTR